jgi:single-strand DNA-binding protein
MPAFNQVTLIGNLTRDPDIRYTPKGTAVARVSLAINRKWRNDAGVEQEEVTFVDCDAWGKTAELVAQYTAKGDPLFVTGRLKLDSWEDKNTGEKKTRLGVVIEQMQFLRSKPDGERRAPAKAKPASAPAVAGDAPPEDDVPF